MVSDVRLTPTPSLNLHGPRAPRPLARPATRSSGRLSLARSGVTHSFKSLQHIYSIHIVVELGLVAVSRALDLGKRGLKRRQF